MSREKSHAHAPKSATPEKIAKDAATEAASKKHVVDPPVDPPVDPRAESDQQREDRAQKAVDRKTAVRESMAAQVASNYKAPKEDKDAK